MQTTHTSATATGHVAFNMLRGLGIFGIIGCHLNLSNISHLSQSILHFCDFNVGLFATLSGYLMAQSLLRHSAFSPVTYIKRRTARLLPTYVFWSVCFIILDAVFDAALGRPLYPHRLFSKELIGIVFQGGASCHLWFLIYLLYSQTLVAALFPLLKRFGFFSAGWMLGASGVLIIMASLISRHYPYASFVCGLAYYLLRLFAFLLFGIGLFLAQKKLRVISCRSWLLVLLLAIVFYFAPSRVPNFCKDMVVVFALTQCFMTLKHTLSGKLDGWASGLSAMSLGVYCVHPLFAALGSLVVKHVSDKPSFPLIAVDWVSIWLLSLSCVWLGKRIGFLRRFLG